MKRCGMERIMISTMMGMNAMERIVVRQSGMCSIEILWGIMSGLPAIT